MRFDYDEYDYGKYVVKDNEDEDFNIVVFTKVHAITLSEILNKLYKQIEYQKRVIDKCIKNEKKYSAIIKDKNELITDLDYEISVLNKEKRILKKIIHESLETDDSILKKHWWE